MESEKSILCMEHCLGKKMFGFCVPQMCPNCRKDLKQSDFRIPPFRVPSPFRNAQGIPCAIVLKPTKGDFLSDYKNSQDLHIGITSSEGIVFEYDCTGLQIDRSWTHCLAIENFTKNMKQISWTQYWDFTLQAVSGQNIWSKELYDEHKHNCYTFVLNVLQCLRIPDLGYGKDRATFCRDFILPKTASAAKYITLYRKLIYETSIAVNEVLPQIDTKGEENHKEMSPLADNNDDN